MQPRSVGHISTFNYIVDLLNQWYKVLRGNISFGDPDNNSTQDNVSGVYVDVVFVAANIEQAVTHNLQQIPVGYVVMSRDRQCTVYQQKATGTAWTTTKIYLKCDTAGSNVRLFIVGY